MISKAEVQAAVTIGRVLDEKQAASELEKLHKSKRLLIVAIKRKRGLQPSELAMWVADVRTTCWALEYAYERVTGKPMPNALPPL